MTFLNDEKLSHISVIGPSKIEPNWKEEFAKEFLVKHKIPTAAYDSFTADTVEKGCEFLLL
jgi:phosphoribosylamine--glycine ligase